MHKLYAGELSWVGDYQRILTVVYFFYIVIVIIADEKTDGEKELVVIICSQEGCKKEGCMYVCNSP